MLYLMQIFIGYFLLYKVRYTHTSKMMCFYFITFSILVINAASTVDIWDQVPCHVDFQPGNCDFDKIPKLSVEDFERCGPALLNRSARNYYLAAAGRRITYNDNKEAYRRIQIVPKILRDVSNSNLEILTLGQKLSFPIGFSPVAFQKLANPHGEIATVRALSNVSTIMILSSHSSIRLEDVAAANKGPSHLWMQVYFYKNRTFTANLVSRAERAGYEAIVATVDSPLDSVLTCNARDGIGIDMPLVNLPGKTYGDDLLDKSSTFEDLLWLRTITNLPIIAKGVLSADDAIGVLRAGANAILVSNHGGRQMDGAPATIDALPKIVEAVNQVSLCTDVYVDGGIRNGWDVYKAIASGAKMVFVGRPIVFGLATAGEAGVRTVLNILRAELEEAMLLSGSSDPSKITKDSLIRPKTNC